MVNNVQKKHGIILKGLLLNNHKGLFLFMYLEEHGFDCCLCVFMTLLWTQTLMSAPQLSRVVTMLHVTTQYRLTTVHVQTVSTWMTNPVMVCSDWVNWHTLVWIRYPRRTHKQKAPTQQSVFDVATLAVTLSFVTALCHSYLKCVQLLSHAGFAKIKSILREMHEQYWIFGNVSWWADRHSCHWCYLPHKFQVFRCAWVNHISIFLVPLAFPLREWMSI